jgi:HPt (histidine-containing phosphotransfer) domain-containing protein
MDDYISKPIDPSQLIQAIERCAPAAQLAAELVLSTEADDEPAARPGRPADDTPLNVATFEELRATLGEEAPKLLPMMLSSYRESGAQLRPLVAEWRADGQADALLRAAHTLNSNSVLVGAPSLAALYRNLEQHAKDGALLAAEALLPQIDAEQARVQAVLDAFLPTLQAGDELSSKELSS